MHKPLACIFDLDGVIVDTSYYHFKAWQRLAKSLSIPFDEDDNQQLKGLSRRASLLKILEIGQKTVPEKEFQLLMDRKNGWYQEYISQLKQDNVLDGILPFLDELENKNIKKAIGSSSKNAKRILRALELTDRFGAIIDGNVIKNAKPDPEVFLRGAAAFNVKEKECIVFEDAASGIEAANRAGMSSVGVGKEYHLNDADTVIPSFREISLKDILKLLED